MVLIATVVGGLVLYVIFERYLRKALQRTQVGRKAVETGTLIAAIVAAGLAVGSLVYTLTAVGALEERVIALEKAARNFPPQRQ